MNSIFTAHPTLEEDVSQRAENLFQENRTRIFQRTDRLFVGLLLLQWVAGIIAAIWISPQTWAGAYSETHLHVWSAIFLGGLITFFPVSLVLICPGTTLTRHVIAISQMLTAALLIHLSGGRIETHFHIFGSLAFLACYRDWRVLISATIVVTLDHYIRGVFYPQSVFGILTASSWRVFEHAGWVIFEDVFLLITISQSLKEMRAAARHRAALERTNEIVEAEVKSRTDDLVLQAKELKISRERALAADRSKSEFLANMSHEIRTPMTAILGFTDLLLEKVEEKESVEAVRTVKHNGEYLMNLINDILDLSKIEAGKIEKEEIDCSVLEVVSDVVSLMRVRAAAKGFPLDVRFDGPIPEKIQSDPTRLRQILINIVGNAIKFTETGSVQIVTRLLNNTEEEPKLQFEIIDSGIGIPEHSIEKLFSAFTQADNSTTRQFGGTGLGLTISKRLVELLGGDISIESNVGKGSTFSVTVSTGPLKNVQLMHNVTVACIKTVDVKLPDDTVLPLDQRRVLLVEDGPDNQRLIGFVLKKAGAEVTLADNGQIGCELATAAKSKGHPFDVILMDMQMPILDGYAATQRLRETGYTQPIIALTAHAMASDRQKCIDAGCNDYATKPIDQKKLIKLVASYIDVPTEV